MSLHFIRIIAFYLIVTGASPFTAPFTTCDLGLLAGHEQIPHDQAGPGPGAWFKPPTDPEKTPVHTVTAALDMPLFGVVPKEAATPVRFIPVEKITHPILRI